MAEQLVARRHVLDEVDRDLLPGAVLLDRGGVARDADHGGPDRDVAAGDAGVVEQAGVLEEDVDQLPEHVVGGLLDLLGDRRVRSGR